MMAAYDYDFDVKVLVVIYEWLWAEGVKDLLWDLGVLGLLSPISLNSLSLEDSSTSLSHDFFHTSHCLSLTQLLHNQSSFTPGFFFQRVLLIMYVLVSFQQIWS
nr:hypothetical protein CFP56_15708 [Quercus suber]